MEAQQACLDALDGKTAPELAREAFISAALATMIHIRSTEDPRQTAMRSGNNTMSGTDSPAFLKANHDAMESIKRIVGKYKNNGVEEN